MYCLVSEKPLRLFIPLIFSGGIWSAADYLAPQGHFLRAPSVIFLRVHQFFVGKEKATSAITA
jgi:hypothetical protein